MRRTWLTKLAVIRLNQLVTKRQLSTYNSSSNHSLPIAQPCIVYPFPAMFSGGKRCSRCSGWRSWQADGGGQVRYMIRPDRSRLKLLVHSYIYVLIYYVQLQLHLPFRGQTLTPLCSEMQVHFCIFLYPNCPYISVESAVYFELKWGGGGRHSERVKYALVRWICSWCDMLRAGSIFGSVLRHSIGTIV